MNDRSGPEFVDPLPGLKRDYEAAVAQLRSEMGNPNSISQRWRFWRARRKLYLNMVVRPARSANW